MSTDIDEFRLEEAQQDYRDALEIEHARKLLGVRNRAPKAVLSGGLLDMAQAAASLGIGVRTLREHLRAGNIRYVDVGRGKERRSPRFAPQDLTKFQEQHRGQSWPSTKEAKSFTRVRVSGSSISGLYGLHDEARSPRVRAQKRQEAAEAHQTS